MHGGGKLMVITLKVLNNISPILRIQKGPLFLIFQNGALVRNTQMVLKLILNINDI